MHNTLSGHEKESCSFHALMNYLSSNEFQGVNPTLVMDAELQFATRRGLLKTGSPHVQAATIWGLFFSL